MAQRRPGPENTAQIFPELTNARGERIEVSAPLDVILELVGQELRWTLWDRHVRDYEDMTMRTLARLLPRLRDLSPTHHATEPSDPPPAATP